MRKLLLVLSIPVLLSFGNITHKASYYGDKFHGRKTANGEIFDKNKMTCAATKEYKFGDYLEVTNVENGKTVTVRVNDRGGFAKYGRTLDLSEGAFKKIAPLKQGIVKVKIKKVVK